jgi:Ca-activated chloride channel family protein
LVNLDTKKQAMALETWDPLPLPPGRYRLDWWQEQHKTRRETLADEITIEPGTLLEVEM